MKTLLSALLPAALALPFVSAPAAAQEADDGPGIDWTVQVGAATDYVSKGISKTNGDPQAWGRVEAGRGDLFAGGFLTNADVNGADAEAQAYVGWRPERFGYEWEFAATYKSFPGANPGLDPDMIELRADVSRSIGPASARLRVEWTPDNFGASEEAWWIESRLGWRFDPKTSASVGLARREQQGGADYTSWNIGLTRKLHDRLSADLRWWDTDGHGFGQNYEGRLVAGLTASF
jgi:uncharacterized protein (TIGR02001 family)